MYYMCYMAVLAPTKYIAISLSLSRSGLAGWLLLAGGRAAGWLAFIIHLHRSQSVSQPVQPRQPGYSHVQI